MVGVYFDNYYTYTNFSLILNKREIESPEIKTNVIDIPGSNGLLDLTEAYGKVMYRNRKIKLNFTFLPSVVYTSICTIYSNLLNSLHGKKMQINFSDHTGYYYYGRVDVGPIQFDKNIGKVEIEVDCDPYKLETSETVSSKTFTDGYQFVLSNDVMPVVPRIQSNKRINIEFKNNVYTREAGTFTIPEIELLHGTNYAYVYCDSESETATVSFTYRKGRL